MNMNKEQKRQRNVEIQKRFQRKLRHDAIKHYGGKCECCGEKRIEFLSISNVLGKKILNKKNNIQIGYWLKKHKYPKGFIVLCHNCNTAIGLYNYCPHAREQARKMVAKK